MMCLFVTSPRPAAALSPGRSLTQAQHRIWQVPQGLPRASVYAVAQSHDGYLWLGTDDGLVRFDGVRFSPAAGLEGSWVHGLAVGRGGDLWAATDGGVRRLSDGRVTAFGTADGLPSDAVRGVAVDPAGTVWAGTAAGLARYAGGRWSAVGPPRDVVALAAVGGAVWSAHGTRAASTDGRSVDAGAAVTALTGGPDGSVWVGTARGLVRAGPLGTHRYTTADGLADDAVTSLSVGSNDTLWVGTRDGFSRFRDGRCDSFRAADGLSQSTVFALAEDREGSLWVGTKHGLNQLVDRRAVPYTQSEGLASNAAGPVVQDAAGTVWVGTRDAGLCRFLGTRFAPPLTTEDGLAADRVDALAVADGGDLWVGTAAGLNRVDGRGRVVPTGVQGLPRGGVSCLCADRDTLWAGVPAGLAAVRAGRATVVRLGPVRAVQRWRDGVVVATAAGLVTVGPQLQVRPLAAVDGADAVLVDAGGLVWAGTRGGGLRLVDAAGHVTAITPADGLFDDDVYGMAADGEGRLWMACSKGVFWAARADLLAFAAGLTRRVPCTPFSPTDALRTVECQPGVQPGVCRARDGRLWFSTIRGVLVFDPADFGRDARPPLSAAVEDVLVDGRPAGPGDLERLRPGVRNLTFRYTALTLVAPAAARFRYRLEGFDRDPVDAGPRREAFYTNLPPGRYRFSVTAALPDGPSGRPATVDVGLTPRLRQRAWFWPAVAALLAAAVWAAYRSRVRQVRERLRVRHAATTAERARIARELHDTLLQGFSGVTMELQALSGRLRDEADRATLAEVIRDAAACMAEARRSVAGLRSDGPAGVDLPAALAAVGRQLTDPADVELRLDLVPVSVSSEAGYQLVRIAQEAIGNAVRHAAAACVTVSLSDGGGRVRLTVADDGRGFDPAAPPPPGHFGLLGIRERAGRTNGTVTVDRGPGGGTVVVVSVPAEHVTSDGRADR